MAYSPSRAPCEDISMSTPRTLGAILYDGFELLDLYGPLEMFGSLGPERVRIVTVAQAPGPIASVQGPKTLARARLRRRPAARPAPAARRHRHACRSSATRRCSTSCARGRRAREVTMSVCSGSAILAKAGLLDGRRATSNKMFFELATRAEREGRVGREGALGRGRSVRDVVRRLGRHRHGARRDREAVGRASSRRSSPT